MSAAFYARMAATAARLISSFGQTITITRVTGGGVDPVTGAVTAGTTENFTPKGILKTYPDALIDGTVIKHSDRMLVIDPTVKPLMTDRVTIDGEQWPILNIKTASPAGVPLAYFLQVRR